MGTEIGSINLYGNIWVRELVFLKTGDEKVGHKHEFDHLHFVAKGSVEISVNKDGEVSSVSTHKAPAWIKVPKEEYHSVRALEDMTVSYCLQAVRDEDGEVVVTDYKKDSTDNSSCTTNEITLNEA